MPAMPVYPGRNSCHALRIFAVVRHTGCPVNLVGTLSAFPTSCQIVRHGNIGQKSRGSKMRLIPVKRIIESIILLFAGVSLLLGLALVAMALKLLIQLKDRIQLS